MSDGKSPLTAWLDTALDCLLKKDVDGWVDHWAENGVIEFPFAPAGYNQRVEGREAIREYMSALPEKFHFDRFDILTTFEQVGSNRAVVEFTCRGKVLENGNPYNQHYVAFLTFDDEGKILLYRDFWNPIVAIEAFGGDVNLVQSFNSEEG